MTKLWSHRRICCPAIETGGNHFIPPRKTPPESDPAFRVPKEGSSYDRKGQTPLPRAQSVTFTEEKN
jgi:hypothetical protein